MSSSNPVTRILFIRHGEVEVAYHRVFGGRIDMELSPAGHGQATSLAHYLADVNIDRLVVSSMRRAQMTAGPLAQLKRLTPLIEPNLREVDFGDWTGLSWQQVQERYGVSAFDWLRELDAGTLPGAEPMPAYRARVAAGLEPVLATKPGDTVAVVCHGGVIRMALSILLDIPLPRMAGFEIDYASVTSVHYRPGKVETQLLNYTPWRKIL